MSGASRAFRFLIIFLSLHSFAVWSATDPDLSHQHIRALFNGPYFTGSEMREIHKNLLDEERGYLIQVPLDYNNRRGRKTKIYASFGHLGAEYKKSQPTLIYFNGGPGVHTHDIDFVNRELARAVDFNILTFDQRGVAFSRFEKIEDALNPDFFSSEFTARDAEAVLDYFGIEEAVVFGSSYGTMPATIFAHLFPERTKAVILEGTVFDGKRVIGSASAQMIAGRLNEVYLKLPEDVREKIQKAIDEDFLYSHIVPSYLEDMISYDGFEGIETRLERMIKQIRQLPIESLEEFLAEGVYESLTDREQPQDEQEIPFLDPYIQDLLNIKELGEMDSRTVTGYHLRKGVIVPGSFKAQSHIRTKSYRFKNIQPNPEPYSAHLYPIQAPLYYFQGSMDPLTDSVGALDHFRQVPQGEATFYLFPTLGHVVIDNIAKKASVEESRSIFDFFNQVVRTGRVREGVMDKVESLQMQKMSKSDLKAALNVCEVYLAGKK